MKRVVLGVGLMVLAGLSWALLDGPIADRLYLDGRELPLRLGDAWPGEPTSVFIVLDTVRADHLSLCGYDRPTSPSLETLRDRGAVWTCDAVTPGSWTLPSHASYFTGLTPTEHGAHSLGSGGEALELSTSEKVRRLDETHPTLAEVFSERGYQSLAISSNPVISKPSGLVRGFDNVLTADGFGKMSSKNLVARLERRLRTQMTRDQPLFVFLNFADAHQPWEGANKDWMKPRGPLRLHASKPEGPWQEWFRGEYAGSKRSWFLGHLADVYDQGVSDADAGVEEALAVLEEMGWCRSGCRVVITSDHGEFLGEHGLLDQGQYLWEPDVRAPLVYWDSEGTDVTLPRRVSALAAYHLALDGALPAPMPAVTSAAWPHVQRAMWAEGRAFTETSAAVWDGDDKLLWVDGEVSRFDLAADPGELSPLSAEDHPALPTLLKLAEDVVASGGEGELDPELVEMLRAAGYLD